MTMLVLAAVGGGLLLSSLLKLAFSRPRPDLVPHEAYVYTSSFPSGHSMMSAATYLTLGALLTRVQPRRLIKAYLLVLATLLTLAVGTSRVYLVSTGRRMSWQDGRLAQHGRCSAGWRRGGCRGAARSNRVGMIPR